MDIFGGGSVSLPQASWNFPLDYLCPQPSQASIQAELPPAPCGWSTVLGFRVTLDRHPDELSASRTPLRSLGVLEFTQKSSILSFSVINCMRREEIQLLHRQDTEGFTIELKATHSESSQVELRGLPLCSKSAYILLPAWYPGWRWTAKCHLQ